MREKEKLLRKIKQKKNNILSFGKYLLISPLILNPSLAKENLMDIGDANRVEIKEISGEIETKRDSLKKVDFSNSLERIYLDLIKRETIKELIESVPLPLYYTLTIRLYEYFYPHFEDVIYRSIPHSEIDSWPVRVPESTGVFGMTKRIVRAAKKERERPRHSVEVKKIRREWMYAKDNEQAAFNHLKKIAKVNAKGNYKKFVDYLLYLYLHTGDILTPWGAVKRARTGFVLGSGLTPVGGKLVDFDKRIVGLVASLSDDLSLLENGEAYVSREMARAIRSHYKYYLEDIYDRVEGRRFEGYLTKSLNEEEWNRVVEAYRRWEKGKIYYLGGPRDLELDYIRKNMGLAIASQLTERLSSKKGKELFDYFVKTKRKEIWIMPQKDITLDLVPKSWVSGLYVEYALSNTGRWRKEMGEHILNNLFEKFKRALENNLKKEEIEVEVYRKGKEFFEENEIRSEFEVNGERFGAHIRQWLEYFIRKRNGESFSLEEYKKIIEIATATEAYFITTQFKLSDKITLFYTINKSDLVDTINVQNIPNLGRVKKPRVKDVYYLEQEEKRMMLMVIDQPIQGIIHDFSIKTEKGEYYGIIKFTRFGALNHGVYLLIYKDGKPFASFSKELPSDLIIYGWTVLDKKTPDIVGEVISSTASFKPYLEIGYDIREEEGVILDLFFGIDIKEEPTRRRETILRRGEEIPKRGLAIRFEIDRFGNKIKTEEPYLYEWEE